MINYQTNSKNYKRYNMTQGTLYRPYRNFTEQIFKACERYAPWGQVHCPWLRLWRKELEWEELSSGLNAVIDAVDQRPIAIWWQFLWRSTILARIVTPRITNTTVTIHQRHSGYKFSGGSIREDTFSVHRTQWPLGPHQAKSRNGPNFKEKCEYTNQPSPHLIP